MRSIRTFAILAAACSAVTAASAAEMVYLSLKINGADIQGESNVTTMGRGNAIQCYSFEMGASTAQLSATGLAPSRDAGRRQYSPIIIRKRIDKSTPLLWKALTNNEAVEGTFRFFRTNAEGVNQHFYTVSFKQGRIASVKNFVSDILIRENTSQPPMEEVSFVFSTITWTYENGGITHQDSMGRGGELAAPLRVVRPPREETEKDRPKKSSAK